MIQSTKCVFEYISYTMVLPTYNEQARVRRVIEYYQAFAPIIVIDNFSSDSTAEIARELGVKVIQYKNPGTIQTPEWMRHIASLVITDYFLMLSCSEFIPAALLQKFNEIATKRSADVVSCVRDSYTCGELIPLWGGKFAAIEARIERFFNRKGLDFDKIVIHGHFTPLQENRLLKLPRDRQYVIAHLRDFDAESHIKKMTEYARVEAQHRKSRERTLTCPKLAELFLREVLRFLHIGPTHWNMISLREVWARMVMHTLIYWLGWEDRSGMTIEHSREKSRQLWHTLALSQKDKGC